VTRVTVRGLGDTQIVVTFSGAEETTRPLCLAVAGWMEGFLGLGARRNIRVDHVACVCDGAGTCDYAVTWEE
jgi:predicted hydrocarbon binding protein